MNNPTQKTLEQLAADVKLARLELQQLKIGHARGFVSYDELAKAGKAVSDALFEYSRVKFPNVKPRKMDYKAIIR